MTNDKDITPPSSRITWWMVGKSIAILATGAACAFLARGAVEAEASSGQQLIAQQAAGNESAAPGSGSSVDYFPAGYTNQGKDGSGEVKTYEHD